MTVTGSNIFNQQSESASIAFIGIDSNFELNRTKIENITVTYGGGGFVSQQANLYIND